MSMMKVSAEFRDFILYFIPGLTLIISIILAFPGFSNLFDLMIRNLMNNQVMIAILVFAASYVAGQLNMTYSFRLWIWLLRKNIIMGDPRVFLMYPPDSDLHKKHSILRPLKMSFSKAFIEKLLQQMALIFGKEIVEEEKASPRLFYLTWRLVELTCQDALWYVYRSSSMFNFSLAMIIPTVILGLVISYRIGNIFPFFPISVIISCIFFLRFAIYYLEWTVNVYWVFYAWSVSQRNKKYNPLEARTGVNVEERDLHMEFVNNRFNN